MSIASVSTPGTSPFSTSGTSYVIYTTLVYMPFIDEDAFQLLAGATQDDPCWTIPLSALKQALTHPEVEVSEGGVAITAFDQSVMVMLPFNETFAFITLAITQVNDFIAKIASTPFAAWLDGHSVAGVIDEGKMPCFD